MLAKRRLHKEWESVSFLSYLSYRIWTRIGIWPLAIHRLLANSLRAERTIGRVHTIYFSLRGVGSRRLHAGILSNEEIHAHDTIDVTRVIAKVDTPERGEDAHEVGPPSGWGLDALALIGSCNDSTSRHIGRLLNRDVQYKIDSKQ